MSLSRKNETISALKGGLTGLASGATALAITAVCGGLEDLNKEQATLIILSVMLGATAIGAGIGYKVGKFFNRQNPVLSQGLLTDAPQVVIDSPKP